VGLNPHIISNHGAFVYTKAGERILDIGLDKKHVREALTWLVNNQYYYTICTDTHSLIPAGSEAILCNDYKTAGTIISGITEQSARVAIDYFCRESTDRIRVDGMAEIVDKDLTYGSIVVITFDQEKLKIGRDYFANYPGLSLNIAGNTVFEMIHALASKGNALEQLTSYLSMDMSQVMAIGDNYNDISMLERVGLSIAMGNAEAAVKKICHYVTLTNDLNGVAHCIMKYI
jgi:Cof subfamily protein (haloacid dehalogenase superfamily)